MVSRASLLSCLLLGAPALAGSPRSDLEPLRWLAGRWQGDGPGGRVEAVWLPPAAGTMAGALRRIREGRVVGHALAVVSEQDGTLVLQLKRFDSHLAGRESQDAPVPRRLTAISESDIAFEGIHVHRRGDAVEIELERPGERPDHLHLARMSHPSQMPPPAAPEDPPVLQAVPAADAPAARATALAWLSGDWIGQGLGGTSEEAWLPPAAGTMTGVYRGSRGGKVTFYELMAVLEAGGSLAFGIKHFAPDLRGWEAPERALEFPLVRLGRSAAYFDGLTYRRTSEGLESWVVIGLGDGGTRPERFLYTPRTP